MTDRTHEVVLRQARAMDTGTFEVGLFKPAVPGALLHAEMLPRTWDLDTLTRSIPWLKYQNVDGRNVFIRPKGEHALSMIDDLDFETVDRMQHSGFTPALIVETSPGNFQAWLNHGRVLPKETSTLAARVLAEMFEGDLGAADWRHFGRLAGFTNRKDKHRQPGGHYPFVRLVRSTGEVYQKAEDFLAEVGARLEAARAEAARRRHRIFKTGVRDGSGPFKSIIDFRRDPRYSGDGNRVDLAYAVYALSRDVSETDVRAAIASRDLGHKGAEKRQTEYIERTIEKALQTVSRECRGR